MLIVEAELVFSGNGDNDASAVNSDDDLGKSET